MASTTTQLIAGTTLQVVLAAINKQMAADAWAADYAARGEKVKLARQYVDGDQDAKLTKERTEQLNLPIGTKSAFTANYCDTVIQTMVDRIDLEKMQADNDKASAWAEGVMLDNDFESLQLDLHEACIRDGDAYLMVMPVNGKPVLLFEPAWDGTSGMLVYYSRKGGMKAIEVAIKVWSEREILRANAYFADRIEKYSSAGGKGLTLMEDPTPWLDRFGMPLGVPVVHFPNRSRAEEEFGLSELENVTPLQDALNRTIHSMIISGEYTAYKQFYTIGLPAPDKTAPGRWHEWLSKNAEGKTQLGIEATRKTEVGTLGEGTMAPFIDQCKFLIQQIGFVTRTPSPEMMAGDNSSGESLKQREIGLLGKVKRFETKISSSWRRVMDLAWKVQATFTTDEQPPEYQRFTPQWGAAELRNDADLIANAKAVRDDVPRLEYLRMIAAVWGWDEDKIKKLADQVQQESDQRAMTLGSQMPTF